MLKRFSMNNQPALKDVAEAAGVSLSTASVIVNGKAAQYRIGPSAQERVQSAVRQLGYKPNIVARKMALGIDLMPVPTTPAMANGLQPKVRQIGLVLSAASQPDILALIPSQEPILTEAGYLLVVVTLPADPTVARERVDRLLTGGVAGFLACPTTYPSVTELVAGNCPVIVLYPNAAKALLQAVARPEAGLLSSQVAELLKGVPPSAAPSPAATVNAPIIATTPPGRPIPTPIPAPVAAAPVMSPPVQTPELILEQPPAEPAMDEGTPELEPTPVPEVTPVVAAPPAPTPLPEQGAAPEPTNTGEPTTPPPTPESEPPPVSPPPPQLPDPEPTVSPPVIEQSALVTPTPVAAEPILPPPPPTPPEPQPELPLTQPPAPQPEPTPVVVVAPAPVPEPAPQPELRPEPVAAEPAIEVVKTPEPASTTVAEQDETVAPTESGTPEQAEEMKPPVEP